MKNIIFLFFLIFIGCNQNRQSKNNAEDSIKFTKAVQKFDAYKNKKINCLQEFDEFFLTGTIAILCYTVSDCQSCVERGYKILDYIQTTMSDFKVAAIVNDSASETKRTKYQYAGKVFNDEKDILLKEFSYLFTPFIIIVNNGSFVDGYYVDNQREEDDDIDYIRGLLKNNKFSSK